MKKYFVLLIVLIFLFSSCATLKKSALMGAVGAGVGALIGGEKGAQIGATIGLFAGLSHSSEIRSIRHIELQRKKLTEKIEQHRLIKPIRVNVIVAYDKSIELELKEVLYRFGFEIVRENPSYEIEIHKEPLLGRSHSYYHGFAQRGYEVAHASVRLVATDKNGREHHFSGIGTYSYRRSYSDGYVSSWSYQDVCQLATKTAVALAVAEFIDGLGFEHL